MTQMPVTSQDFPAEFGLQGVISTLPPFFEQSFRLVCHSPPSTAQDMIWTIVFLHSMFLGIIGLFWQFPTFWNAGQEPARVDALAVLIPSLAIRGAVALRDNLRIRGATQPTDSSSALRDRGFEPGYFRLRVRGAFALRDRGRIFL